MKKIAAIGSVFALALLVACGDDNSSSAASDDDETYSSVEQSSSSSEKAKYSSSVEESSSSEKTPESSSSSSVILSGDSHEGSCSSSVKSSSSSSSVILSAGEESSSSATESSSSVEESSSSGVTPELSFSSSEDKVNCSELLEGETGWSWDVPKECRFNPDIDYGTMTDTRDNKQYKTVKIGDQVWMAENLNFDPGQGGSGDAKYDWSWCYDNEPKKCDVAGRLYTWAAAIDSVKLATDTKNPQDCGDGKKCALPDTVYGVCPPGWHLPSKAEFGTLLTVMGGQSTASKGLKSQSGWAESKNGTDAFGFTALPVGGWDPHGIFYLAGNGAYFWSATGFDADYAEHLGIDYDKENTFLDFTYKHGGNSVRCIKNN